MRTIFQHIAHIAKAIYEGVLKPYTFPRPRNITAYNRMVQINKDLFDDRAWDPAKLKIFDGPLFNPGIASATVSGATVAVSFDGSEGEGTDAALAVVHDELTGNTYHGQAARADVAVSVSIAGLDPSALYELHAYLVFSRPPAPGTGEQGQVSGTAYLAVS